MSNINEANVLKKSLNKYFDDRRVIKKKNLKIKYERDLANLKETINCLDDMDDAEKEEMLIISQKKLTEEYKKGICLNSLFGVFGALMSILFFPGLYLMFSNFVIGLFLVIVSILGALYFGNKSDNETNNCKCNKCLMEEIEKDKDT